LTILFAISCGFVNCIAKVISITDSNWKSILEGEWMVKFYAPWCPACRQLQPTWDKLAEWADARDVSIGAVDVTQQLGVNGRFMITALPTIYHIRDGKFRAYSGDRAMDDFTSFIQEEQWIKIDPIPSWKSPTGYLMGGLSKIFGLSVYLKDWHDHMSSDYGLPQWGVVSLFALTVLAVGLLLGAVLVFIGDWMWPDNYEYAQQPTTTIIKTPTKDETQLTDEDRQTDEEESKFKMAESKFSNTRHRKVKKAE